MSKYLIMLFSIGIIPFSGTALLLINLALKDNSKK